MDGASLIAQARRCVNEGDFARAAEHFEWALAQQPESAVALGGLGHCLGRLGRRREARDCLLRAGRVVAKQIGHTKDGSALLDVAYELHLVNAFEESLGLIDRALKMFPAAARGHYLKAQALSRLQRRSAARHSAVRAMALAPGASNASIFLATLEAEAGELESARSRLQSIAASLIDPNRSRACFELGRVLDRLGDCDAAFESLALAGRLALDSPAIRRFDLSRIYRELQDERDLCTGAWFERCRVPPDDGLPDPVFLIGFYRSGTTLLEQILSAHPQLLSSDETDLVPQVSRELYRLTPGASSHWPFRIESLGEAGIARLRRHYWTTAKACLGAEVRDRVLIDKTALNTINVGLIRTLFPNAPIVFVVRDPRDVCLSCFMQAFVPNTLTAHFLDWEEGARFYDGVMNHWEAMRARWHRPATIVRYEDLVADPRTVTGSVLEALGFAWDPRMERFHEIARTRSISTPSFADVTQPVYRTAEGRWRRYERHFDSIRGYLEPHIRRCGYG